jgi:hypothetical protein
MLIVNEKQLYNKHLFSLIIFYAEPDRPFPPAEAGVPDCSGLLRNGPRRKIAVEAFGGIAWEILAYLRC